MKKLVIYIHGKGGNAGETEHYKPLFPEADVVGFDYQEQTPWAAKVEFTELYKKITTGYNSVVLIANSIGAYFSMHTFSGCAIEKAFFISPIVDMQVLIENMMSWANVTEEDLRTKGKIETSFGETLDWEYLNYVRSHPIEWNIPTYIAYGEKDNLMPYSVIEEFTKKVRAKLSVMKCGEHWFHTPEQMAFIDEWILNNK